MRSVTRGGLIWHPYRKLVGVWLVVLQYLRWSNNKTLLLWIYREGVKEYRDSQFLESPKFSLLSYLSISKPCHPFIKIFLSDLLQRRSQTKYSCMWCLSDLYNDALKLSSYICSLVHLLGFTLKFNKRSWSRSMTTNYFPK